MNEVKVIDQASGEGWHLYNGDSAEILCGLPDDSIDLSVYSPPFSSLYTYSNSDRDLGNAATREEFFEHYAFIVREILRVTRPGRNTVVHVQQIASTLAHDGVIGMTDFRGDVIRAYQAEGWIYHGEACIQKDPQAQAIRTHSKSLLFVQLHRDASWMRPALADYILVFRRPGENAVPVVPNISNEDWIEWARPIWQIAVSDADKQLISGSDDVFDLAPATPLLWYGIRESDTLNGAVARENEDERHIAPLQLETIERCIRLWSNPGETVLDPFTGIGSSGVVALRHGRRFVGAELKSSYYKTATENLRRERLQGQLDLFSEASSG